MASTYNVPKTPPKATTSPLRASTSLWEVDDSRRTYVAPIEPNFKMDDFMGEYIFLMESGQVRPEFATHSPEEVAEMEDPDQLHHLADALHHLISPCITLHETNYLEIMQTCISLRLSDLTL